MVLRGAIISLGITLAIGVAAAFLINRFRAPLENIFQSTGQALGGIVSKPIFGFLEGFSAVIGKLPDIDIKIPSINIIQGTLNFQGDSNASSIAGQTVPFGDEGQTVTIPPDTSIDPETGIVTSTTPPIANPAPTPAPSPLPNILPSAEGATLTPFNVGLVLPVGTAGALERQTREQILANNPNAIGLFDLSFTEGLDFEPLGVEAVKFFQSKGVDVTLSAQLFGEFSNVSDIV